MSDQKFLDLDPSKWRSDDDRQKPHEPLFGAGWPTLVSVAAAITLSVVAIQLGAGHFMAGIAGAIGGAIGAAISDAFQ